MKTSVLAVVVTLGAATSALACPNIHEEALANVDVDGDTLYQVLTLETAAGGDNALADCELGAPGAGYFATAPDIAFQLSEMAGYERLEFRAEAACDTIMLVQGADGEIQFNDDTNGSNPAIAIDVPSDGTYLVWLGTYGAEACAASLSVETF